MAKLNERVEEAINEQIKHEFYAAYLYLSMAAFFEGSNLPGFAKWMRSQAQEEVEHAMKFFDYVMDRGGRVKLQPIEGPPTEFDGPIDVFEKSLAHEQKVTERINEIYKVALDEGDYASQAMLNWFLTEQVEEEKNADQVLAELRMVGESKASLYFLDRHVMKMREDMEEEEGEE
jgi:ferritin